MRRLRTLGPCVSMFVLALAASASAAPNVANATQKGSLLIWPDVRVDGGWNTIVRVQNDGSADVDVICYWMDGNKNRVDFIVPVTRNQAVWFDARTGNGTSQVNRFPSGPANGFDNPFLPGGAGPYGRGLLACWAADAGAQHQVKWNHLSGTATVYQPGMAYEYSAYAFFVPTGIDQQPVGAAGTLNLDGVGYDACPLYQVGFIAPAAAAPSPFGVRTVVSDFGVGPNQGAFIVGVAVEAGGTVIVVDADGGTGGRGSLIRVDPVTGARTVLSDFGVGANQGVNPLRVAVEASGNLLVVDQDGGVANQGVLFRVDPVTGARTVLSSFGVGPNPGQHPFDVAVEAGGTIVVVDPFAGTGGLGALFRVDPVSGARTVVSDFGVGANQGVDPRGVAVEASGTLLVADFSAGTGGLGALFRVDPVTGARTLLSDLGVGPNPGVNPDDVLVDASGAIFVVDQDAGTGGRGALFQVDPVTGVRTVVSDFGVGPNQGADPTTAALEAGGTLVITDVFAGTDADGALFRIVAGASGASRLTLAACTLDLRQDWVPAWTKWQFDVWNADEVKFTGAFECADTWHETTFGADLDAARQNFAVETIGTGGGRFRVQGVKSSACDAALPGGQTTQAVGVLAVESHLWSTGMVGTTMTGAGKATGRVTWDPEGAVPEGGIR